MRALYSLAFALLMSNPVVASESTKEVEEDSKVPMAFVEALTSSNEQSMDARLAQWVDSADDAALRQLVPEGDAQESALFQALTWVLVTADGSPPTQASLTIDDVFARIPEVAQSGPWLALAAQAQLLNGQMDRALASARAALAAGGTLCTDRCSDLVEVWLKTGTVPAIGEWPRMSVPTVYNPMQAQCESASGGDPFEAAVVRGNLGVDGELALRLRRQWSAALNGCVDHSDYQLDELVKERFPAMMAQRSYTDALRSLSSDLPASIQFLGVDLPLPASECDFSGNADCGTTKALSRETATALTQVLRSFLTNGGTCPEPLSETDSKKREALEAQLEKALKALDARPAMERLKGTQAILGDARFRSLWSRHVQYAVVWRLQAAMPGPTAALALDITQAWNDKLAVEVRESTSIKDLLATLLVRNGKANLALAELESAQLRSADASRALTISRLRAAAAGAAVPLPETQIARPWTLEPYGNEYPFRNEISDADIAFVAGGMRAYARHALAQYWAQALSSSEPHKPLIAILEEAYGSEALLDMGAKAVDSAVLDGDAHLVFDGVHLPLPNAYIECDEEECSDEQTWTKAKTEQAMRRAGMLQ